MSESGIIAVVTRSRVTKNYSKIVCVTILSSRSLRRSEGCGSVGKYVGVVGASGIVVARVGSGDRLVERGEVGFEVRS